MEVKQEKSLLRKEILKKRNALSEEERTQYSDRIRERAERLPVYKEAAVLCFYVDIRSEVKTRRWIEAALRENRTVALPKVEDGEIEFYRIASLLELTPGYQGILEPARNAKTRLRFGGQLSEDRTLLLMPGAVFDRAGGRIGYGGGFYDKYLAKHKGVRTMALAYECQLVEKVPVQEHDRRVECIVTEGREESNGI